MYNLDDRLWKKTLNRWITLLFFSVASFFIGRFVLIYVALFLRVSYLLCFWKVYMLRVRKIVLSVSPVKLGHSYLTINLLNFMNGIIHLPYLELSIIIFRKIKMRTWLANSIEPGHATFQWDKKTNKERKKIMKLYLIWVLLSRL